jgi:formylglycine-generating enzyme required for sulfatase activity
MPLILQSEPCTAQYFTEELEKGIGLDMVQILGGTFWMGSPEGELEREDNEGPQHPVNVPDFFMGKYPVTQAQWEIVANWEKIDRDLTPNPSNFKGPDKPVEQVSWLDAIEFCQRLSKKTGQFYSLPSEAQWEYACRANTTTPFYFGETITPKLANIGDVQLSVLQVINHFSHGSRKKAKEYKIEECRPREKVHGTTDGKRTSR